MRVWIVVISETFLHREIAEKAKEAAIKAVLSAESDPKSPEDLQAHGAIGDTLESLAKLATSLKDLDVGTRVLVLGIALFAIAGISAGVDAIAGAVIA